MTHRLPLMVAFTPIGRKMTVPLPLRPLASDPPCFVIELGPALPPFDTHPNAASTRAAKATISGSR